MTEKTRRLALTAAIAVFVVSLAAIGWHLFDTYVDRSGWVERDGVYSYRDFHGKKVSAWQTIDEKRYYFDADGTMLTHWQTLDGGRYYFGRDGALDLGWLDIDGRRYYSGSDGVIRTGWQDIEFQRYYFLEDGSLYTGWFQEDGKTYHFGDDGAMALGLVQIEGATYHFSGDGNMHTGPLELNGDEYLFGGDGVMFTGWLREGDSVRYYGAETGILAKEWAEIDGKRYYFGEDGYMVTGWLQLGEYRYFLQEDGAAAVGPLEIDGTVYYFTPKGIHVVLVNTKNRVPRGYDADLVTVVDYHRVSQVALEPLQRMLADCVAAGNQYTFNSAFRSLAQQQEILDLRTQEYENLGMSHNAAYAKARQTVALPGTSEHHLGLAVDLLGADAIAWLGEHCWEYGFILRYTEDKEHITGFVDEPWHFRYVGTEVSMDMKDSGLCLEEYLGAWTEPESN